MALGTGEQKVCICVCGVKGRNVTLRFGSVSGNESRARVFASRHVDNIAQADDLCQCTQ